MNHVDILVSLGMSFFKCWMIWQTPSCNGNANSKMLESCPVSSTEDVEVGAAPLEGSLNQKPQRCYKPKCC